MADKKTPFTLAVGLAVAQCNRLNSILASNRIVDPFWQPTQTLLYIAGKSGKVGSQMKKADGTSAFADVTGDADMADAICLFNGNMWVPSALSGSKIVMFVTTEAYPDSFPGLQVMLSLTNFMAEMKIALAPPLDTYPSTYRYPHRVVVWDCFAKKELKPNVDIIPSSEFWESIGFPSDSEFKNNQIPFQPGKHLDPFFGVVDGPATEDISYPMMGINVMSFLYYLAVKAEEPAASGIRWYSSRMECTGDWSDKISECVDGTAGDDIYSYDISDVNIIKTSDTGTPKYFFGIKNCKTTSFSPTEWTGRRPYYSVAEWCTPLDGTDCIVTGLSLKTISEGVGTGYRDSFDNNSLASRLPESCDESVAMSTGYKISIPEDISSIIRTNTTYTANYDSGYSYWDSVTTCPSNPPDERPLCLIGTDWSDDLALDDQETGYSWTHYPLTTEETITKTGKEGSVRSFIFSCEIGEESISHGAILQVEEYIGDDENGAGQYSFSYSTDMYSGSYVPVISSWDIGDALNLGDMFDAIKADVLFHNDTYGDYNIPVFPNQGGIAIIGEISL